MEVANIQNARRERAEENEHDPGNMFRVVDPHRVKIPNPKTQIPKPKEPPHNGLFGTWELELPWDLGFGIWDFHVSGGIWDFHFSGYVGFHNGARAAILRLGGGFCFWRASRRTAADRRAWRRRADRHKRSSGRTTACRDRTCWPCKWSTFSSRPSRSAEC